MPYKVVKVDLSTARTTPEKVLEVEKEIEEIVVTRVDAESYIILDHPNNDPIYCSIRLRLKYPTKIVYVKNPTGSGFLEFFAKWDTGGGSNE